MARPMKELAPACRQAADNINPAIISSFNQAIKRGQPRFRDAARAAAGGDRILSRHRNKTKLDAQMLVKIGRKPFLVVNAKGPWGIRDSTDAASNRTSAHVITPKRGKTLKFSVGGQAFYAKRVNHPGSRRGQYWKQGRTEALRVVQERIPKDVSDAIIAAFNGKPYKSRG
jgi:hypothetical protein